MSSYILDYDIKKRTGTIKSTNLDLVRECFSVEDQGAKFAKIKHRYSFLPTRKYAITPTGKFETGLTIDVVKQIYTLDPDATIQLTEPLKQAVFPGINITPENIPRPKSIQLRDYQEDVVLNAVKKGRGIVMIATAGGKTLVMSTLISTLLQHSNKKIVVITPTQLTKQTYTEFISHGINWSCTWWTGEHIPDKNCEVVVAGINILQSDKQDVTWLFDADILIIDEVHKLRHGNTLNKIIKKFITNKKYGFTGTLPENLIDQWVIKGLTGPVIYEKSSYDLRAEDYIAKAMIQILHLKYKDTPQYGKNNQATDNYIKEINFIINNQFRNNIIKKLCNRNKNNTLVLVDRIEHGENIYNAITQDTTKQVYFIRGEVDVSERDNVKRLMEERTDVICIAISSIFSTGINIKNLHYIIFAASGKAKIKIIQSIGRGLRLHPTKSELTIYDLYDDLKYGKLHHEKRKLLYEKEKIPYKITELSEP